MNRKNCVAIDASLFDKDPVPGAKHYREQLTAWLEMLDDPDLRRRLLSRRDADNFSARLELALAGMFSARGWVLAHHPRLPGVTKRPEFLVETPTGEFICEARMLHEEELERQQWLRLDVVAPR